MGSDAQKSISPPTGIDGPTWTAVNKYRGSFYRYFCDKKGIKEAAGDPRSFGSSFTLTKGTLHLSRVPLEAGRKINGVGIHILTAATATITPGQNFVGILDENGNPLWSYGADALFALTGEQKIDIANGTPAGSLVVPDGTDAVFVGLICNTSGTALIPFGSTASGSSDGPIGTVVETATGGTGLTAWPTTVATLSQAAHNQAWAFLY